MNTMMLPSIQTDKTLSIEGVAADSKAVGAAISSVKGMLKIAKVKLSDISVNIDNNSYYYSKPVSFADKIPANAMVLAVTATDWWGVTCGSISVYNKTTNKSTQIMANRSGSVHELYLDVLYIEKA